nr:serine hydrolase [Paenalcaligenes hominis]
MRDYGRFGQFLLNDGVIDGEEILPKGWVKEAGSPKDINGERVNYGYMLWPIPNADGTVHEGAFEARGIFGQHVYVNPKHNVVIAAWGALPKPQNKATVPDNDVFAAIVQALQ